jgi:hypothetical protein
MRVRFVGLPMVEGRRPKASSLTVGNDYVVLAISSHDAQPMKFLVLTDRREPIWYPASHFDLVSDTTPSTWRVLVGRGGHVGYLQVAPAPWLEPGFLEAFWGDGGVATIAARATFERELEIILRESS